MFFIPFWAIYHSPVAVMIPRFPTSNYCVLVQVCSILWSKHHKELISGHGFSRNQLTIWKYPSMTKVFVLLLHFFLSFNIIDRY